MIFKNFQDEKISALGFGAMRLPCTDGKIDEAAVAKMVKTAMDSVINYYDIFIFHAAGEKVDSLSGLLRSRRRG